MDFRSWECKWCGEYNFNWNVPPSKEDEDYRHGILDCQKCKRPNYVSVVYGDFGPGEYWVAKACPFCGEETEIMDIGMTIDVGILITVCKECGKTIE